MIENKLTLQLQVVSVFHDHAPFMTHLSHENLFFKKKLILLLNQAPVYVYMNVLDIYTFFVVVFIFCSFAFC